MLIDSFLPLSLFVQRKYLQIYLTCCLKNTASDVQIFINRLLMCIPKNKNPTEGRKNPYKLAKCFIRHGNGGRIGFGRVSKFVELGRPYVP